MEASTYLRTCRLPGPALSFLVLLKPQPLLVRACQTAFKKTGLVFFRSLALHPATEWRGLWCRSIQAARSLPNPDPHLVLGTVRYPVYKLTRLYLGLDRTSLTPTRSLLPLEPHWTSCIQADPTFLCACCLHGPVMLAYVRACRLEPGHTDEGAGLAAKPPPGGVWLERCASKPTYTYLQLRAPVRIRTDL